MLLWYFGILGGFFGANALYLSVGVPFLLDFSGKTPWALPPSPCTSVDRTTSNRWHNVLDALDVACRLLRLDALRECDPEFFH